MWRQKTCRTLKWTAPYLLLILVDWLLTSLKFPHVSLLEKEISGETGEVDDGFLSIVNHITASKKVWREWCASIRALHSVGCPPSIANIWISLTLSSLSMFWWWNQVTMEALGTPGNSGANPCTKGSHCEWQCGSGSVQPSSPGSQKHLEVERRWIVGEKKTPPKHKLCGHT